MSSKNLVDEYNKISLQVRFLNRQFVKSLRQGKLCKIVPWCTDYAKDITKHADNRKVWLNLLDVFPSPYILKDAVFWISFNLTPENTGKLTIQLTLTVQGKNFALCVLEDNKWVAVGSIGIKTNEISNMKHVVELG